MRVLFLLVASIAAVSAAAGDTLHGHAKVTIDADGVTGEVVIWDNGTLTVMLDTTGSAYAAGGAFSYHIHTDWLNGGPSGTGPWCSLANTSLHWDPSVKCGAKSGNPDCASCGMWGGDIRTGTYATACSGNQQECEVGDLSGKYGTYPNDQSTFMGTDVFMPHPDDVATQSIVFHQDGARVICGQFVGGPEKGSGMRPNLHSEKMMASFGAAGRFIIHEDGSHEQDIDFSMVDGAIAAPCEAGATGVAYHIHEAWTHTDADFKVGPTDCGGGPTGLHVDPTAGCGAKSGNVLCNNTQHDPFGCVGPSSAYGCTTTSSAWECEGGDLSKFTGTVDLTAGKAVSARAPATADQVNKYAAIGVAAPMSGSHSIVWHCGGARQMCAKLVPFADPTGPPPPPATDPTSTDPTSAPAPAPTPTSAPAVDPPAPAPSSASSVAPVFAVAAAVVLACF